MKIKEYANVNEYTEVVDAPYNLTSGEEVLDERPMGFVKGGLQKLGSKLLPGSYGRAMTGKVKLGTQANKLYGDFHEFLGQSGYKSTDDAVRAFLQQSGINVDIDSILKGAAPAPAASKGFNVKLPKKAPPAPAPAPVTESVDNLNRILILSGRSPKKIINEEVALDRAALNKIFMQVAQQQMGGKGGGAPAPAPAPKAPAPTSSAPAPAPAPKAPAPTSSAPAPAPKAPPAPGSGDFGGDGPATAPTVEPPTASPTTSTAPTVEPPAPPPAPAPAPKAPAPAPTATKPPAANPKQSIQDVNKYLNNVAVQAKNPDLTPEQKSELAKELINFMADRKGTPEYDNAIGGAQKLVKNLDSRLTTRIATGKTAVQNPQGIRNPPKAPPAPAPTAPPKASPAPAPTAPTAADPAPRKGFNVDLRQSPAQKKTADLLRAAKASQQTAESKILDRNSYIFLKDVLESTNLTLRDLGYRVSVSESTSDSITLIPR
jgi:hypothetical protein